MKEEKNLEELITPNPLMPVQIEDHLPLLFIILGIDDTSKSTFIKKLVVNEIKKKDSHVLIVTPDKMEWGLVPWVSPDHNWKTEKFVKARKIIYEKGLLQTISDNFRSGMLIFDECGAYFTAAMNKTLKSLVIRRRQKMIDIVIVAQGFNDVPKTALPSATHYVLFRTTDNIDKRKYEIHDFMRIREAQLRVNKITEEIDPHYYEIIII